MPSKRKEPSSTFWAELEAKQAELIVEALYSSSGNIRLAASDLGIDRTYLHKLIRSLGITRGQSWSSPKIPEPLMYATVDPRANGGFMVTYGWRNKDGTAEVMREHFSDLEDAKVDAADFMLCRGDWEE
jgi:AraC-like DNA-binding protein